LFKLEDVNSVFLGADFVTVGKASHADWVALKPQIFALLMDAFAEEVGVSLLVCVFFARLFEYLFVCLGDHSLCLNEYFLYTLPFCSL